MNRWVWLLVISAIVFGGCAGGMTPTADGHNQSTYSKQREESTSGGGGGY